MHIHDSLDQISSLEIDIEAAIDPKTMASHAEYTEKQKQKARAIKTVNRLKTRRAHSEATLATLIPSEIEENESWHILSSGDIDAISYLAHLINSHRMDLIILSTWCMALYDVKQLEDWLHNGKIKRLDAYVGEIFPNQYLDAYIALCKIVREHQGRVAVFRNHSKLFLCKAGLKHWVIESSANINTNPRTENTVITASKPLYQHHKAYFDGIHAFNRDFDDWEPHAS